MEMYWMISFLVLVFIELITVNLVTIWFALGALVSLIVSYFTDSVPIQIFAFLFVSIVSLLATRKIVNKLKVTKVEPTNLDRIIGQVGIVTDDISENDIGEVKIDGKRWSAKSSESISVGSKVEILSIEGVKLNVKKIKEG